MSKTIHLIPLLVLLSVPVLQSQPVVSPESGTILQPGTSLPSGTSLQPGTSLQSAEPLQPTESTQYGASWQYAVTDSIELDQIVITASKIPLSLRETTKPVLIIDRQEIEQNGSRNLGQLLHQQSGIRINDAFGSPANAQMMFMQGASGPYTLILVDGLPVTDPSGTGGTYDLRLLPLNNVERIEILQGSQSTLYGTDAIAGVVNILTRSGNEGLVNGSGQLSYGSYHSMHASAAVNGTIDRKHSYTLNFKRESSNGFSAAADPDNAGTFGDDGFRSNSFYGKAEISVTDGLTVSPFFHYNDFDGDYDAGAFQDADNAYSLKMINTGFQTAFRRAGLNVNGGYNLTSTERGFSDQFGDSSFEGVFHNADLFGSYAISPWLSVLGGFHLQQSIIPASVGAEELSARIASPYATLYVKGLHGFSTELGYRLNSHSEYGNNATYSFAPAYHVTENVKLFGSVTTGFKVPTLNELFGPFGANPGLDPETSRYASVGVETYLMQQSLKLRAQYFSREIDDVIVYTFTEGFINRDRQSDSGMELSANWIAAENIRIGGYYNYTDGELITIDDSGEEMRRNNLLRRPAHSFGLHLGVNVTEHLLVRIDGEYNGERTDLFFNPENNFAGEEVTLDPYTLVNLYTEYRLPTLRAAVFADVRNLLDTGFAEVYGFNTAGFTIKGGVRVAL